MSNKQLLALGLATLFLGLSTVPAQAREQINLTVPYDPDSRTTPYFRVKRVLFFEERKQLIIALEGDNGIERLIGYNGDDALDFHRQINRPNAARSRDRVILMRLIADGKLAGSVSGSPD